MNIAVASRAAPRGRDAAPAPLPLGDPSVDARLLGPLRATIEGTSIVPTATKTRTVLALLLLNGDHVVSIGALQRELWGDNPPRTAHTTVQTYILQLRRLISGALGGRDDTAKRVLRKAPSGYVLRVAGVARDVETYDGLAEAGAAALHDGDVRNASRLLTDALQLWDGEPLGDVTAGPQMRAEIVRLESSRTTVLEQRIAADLELGQHQRVLSELAALTVQHPFNENFRGQYMLALHRCGRRREALAAYQQMRRLLVNELGLEPDVPLRRLHQAILSGDEGPRRPPVAAAS